MARSEKQRKLAANRRAKKIKRGRGRPMHADAPRTPSGQISRAKESTGDPMAVALAYRKEQYGLSEEQAKDQKAETAFGRAFLRKHIDLVHYQAAENYLKRYEAAMAAIKAPVGLKKAGAGGGGGDLVTVEYTEWAIRAVVLYEVAKAWLDDVQLRAVVDAVVTAGTECDAATAPFLKRGLAHLAKRMGIEVEVAA